MIQLLIFEPCASLLQEMANALKNTGAFSTISPCGSLDAAREAIKACNYTLAILDFDAKSPEKTDLLVRLRRSCPEAKIIVSTLDEEPWTIKFVKQLRVQGVVLKSPSMETLLETVSLVMAGGTHLCERFNYMSDTTPNPNAKCEKPTEREMQVLKMLAEGRTSEEIALILDISIHTVETHRRSLREKLHAETPSHLISIALKEGLIELDKLELTNA